MKTLLKIFLVLAVLVAIGVFGWPYLLAYWRARNKPEWRLAKVAKGEIVMVVNSTGTVQPVRRVQVGAVVSGPIEELLADHNDKVQEGQVLAKIDPRVYNAAKARDEATCKTAQAEVKRVEAQLKQARADEERGKKLRERQKDPKKYYISDTELDRLKYTREALEAQLELAKAQVEQAEGNLKNSDANLKYTQIWAPEAGIVIDRKIEKGQSLASSFQTPELFVVAPEMEKHMYVYASVDEADIGHIRQAEQRDNPVFFTVDAYPDDLFQGKFLQQVEGETVKRMGIRKNPTTVQNVVTYTVVVDAPNPEMKLLPGMTAKLSFEIEKHSGIVKIPNAALRFYPKLEQVRPEDHAILEGTEDQDTSDEAVKTLEAQRSAMERAAARRSRNRRHVWVVEGELLRAIEVHIGISDSQYTELTAGDLQEGQDLVTGIRPRAP